MDGSRLANPRNQIARSEVVEQELKRLRLGARLVSTTNVESESGRVQRVALGRLGIPGAEQLLIHIVAHGARHFERPSRGAQRVDACADVDERRKCFRAQAAVQLLRLTESRGELAHRRVDREPQREWLVRQRLQDALVPGSLQIGRVGEALGLEGRVQRFLGTALRRVQEVELLQAIPVLAVETHDLLRREHAPVVGRRVVTQPRQQRVRGCVSVGGSVEEDARPREILFLHQVGHREVGAGRVRAQDVREVADAHVVRDHREVVAPQPLACRREIANGARERLLGIEPRVDAPALLAQTLCQRRVAALEGFCDSRRQSPARLEIHLHAEEVLRGLGQDLCETGGGDGIVSCDDVRTAAALEEDDRLDEIRLEAAPVDGILDQAAEGLRALGGGEDAAGALGVERMTEPEGGGALEIACVRVVVDERVRRRCVHVRNEDGARRVVRAEQPGSREHDRREQGDREGGSDDSTTANDHATGILAIGGSAGLV